MAWIIRILQREVTEDWCKNRETQLVNITDLKVILLLASILENEGDFGFFEFYFQALVASKILTMCIDKGCQTELQ